MTDDPLPLLITYCWTFMNTFHNRQITAAVALMLQHVTCYTYHLVIANNTALFLNARTPPTKPSFGIKSVPQVEYTVRAIYIYADCPTVINNRN
jgi:hypothetical protein